MGATSEQRNLIPCQDIVLAILKYKNSRIHLENLSPNRYEKNNTLTTNDTTRYSKPIKFHTRAFDVSTR